MAIALAAIAGYKDRYILSFLYHSINLAIYSMDKQKNVCYNYIGNRCKAWEAIMNKTKSYLFAFLLFLCYTCLNRNVFGGVL